MAEVPHDPSPPPADWPTKLPQHLGLTDHKGGVRRQAGATCQVTRPRRGRQTRSTSACSTAPASSVRRSSGLGCEERMGGGKDRDPKTHPDRKGGVSQELHQAVAAALVPVPHPDLVFPCGPLGPCQWGRVVSPRRCPMPTALCSAPPGKCAGTVGSALGRDQHIPQRERAAPTSKAGPHLLIFPQNLDIPVRAPSPVPWC